MTPLHERLISSSCTFRDLDALSIEGVVYTYSRLFKDAFLFANHISASTPPLARVGIFASRSYIAYVGILACILAGRTYVPIGARCPFARQLDIVRQSDCVYAFVDPTTETRAYEVSNALGRPLIVVGESDLFGLRSSASPELLLPTFSDDRAPAYVMFTSGTTSRPKGVVIARSNLGSYLSGIRTIFSILPGERCSQFFDLAFDLSVHDMFFTWTNGGCLYVPSAVEMFDPVRFARINRLNCWFSVPSVVSLAARMKRTTPGRLPDLRLSLFCGEALPTSIAALWSSVAPKCDIWNLYGPTEATIAVTAHRFDPEANASAAVVPLGAPWKGSGVGVLKCVENIVRSEGTGELVLRGEQISPGYFDNEEQNRKNFVVLKSGDRAFDRWYRTGDMVELLADGTLRYLGRIDDQVKIQGFRVEILEVEAVLRAASKALEVAAVAWPQTHVGSAAGIVGFVCSSVVTELEITEFCHRLLPNYMVPNRIIFVESLPLNANGKVDRRGLIERHLEMQPSRRAR